MWRSDPYRAVYNAALDHVIHVADAFHLIRLANDNKQITHGDRVHNYGGPPGWMA